MALQEGGRGELAPEHGEVNLKGLEWSVKRGGSRRQI